MSDEAGVGNGATEELASLRARADRLEKELLDMGTAAKDRLIRAELRMEAVKAGMIDLDGLKLANLTQVSVGEDGEVQGGAALMDRLRGEKPWLFARASSSSTASPPPGAAVKAKLATEMSLDEWKVARAELLRRR